MTIPKAIEVLKTPADYTNEEVSMAVGLAIEALDRMDGETGYFILKDKVNDGRLTEVVRCEDCRRWDPMRPSPALGRGFGCLCNYSGHYHKPDYYCASGERKINEQEV